MGPVDLQKRTSPGSPSSERHSLGKELGKDSLAWLQNRAVSSIVCGSCLRSPISAVLLAVSTSKFAMRRDRWLHPACAGHHPLQHRVPASGPRPELRRRPAGRPASDSAFEHLRLYGHAATKATKVMAGNEQDVVVLVNVTICSTPNIFFRMTKLSIKTVSNKLLGPKSPVKFAGTRRP